MKKVAVIGAGVAGLCTIKSCLEEGLDVQCFEANSDVGGLWCYNECRNQEFNSVHYCTYMNSSKEISAFSDFAPPETFPNFTHHSLVKEYLSSYASHFDLKKRIRFNARVNGLKRCKDGIEKELWIVSVLDLLTNTEIEFEYDAVAVCTGLLSKPNLPHMIGLDNYKGEVLHSVSYKNASQFRGKNVAVIGIGNSAVDIAVDLSNVASNVYLSSRRGSWIFRRSGPRGFPSDLTMMTRFLLECGQYVPRFLRNKYMGRRLNATLDHDLYALRPDHGVLEHSPLINDEISFKLMNGSVVLKRDIQKFFPTGVLFQGDNDITPIDCIICATGFSTSVDFLSEKLNIKDDKGVHLYKQVFPPTEQSATIGFIGFIATFGPSNPMMEMQSRWFAAVISDRISLPDTKTMLSRIRDNQLLNASVLLRLPRHIWYTDYLPYMDGLASELGAKPNLLITFFKDPILFWHCVFGPLLSYQYRLTGPHSCPNARENIISYRYRVLRPFRIVADQKTW